MKRTTLLVCLLLVALSWSKERKVKFLFQGNESYSAEDLEAQLSLPSEFSVLETQRMDFFMRIGVANLEGMYAANGYFHARVGLSVVHEPDTLEVPRSTFTLTVSEGPRYMLGTVSIDVPGWSRQLVDPSSLHSHPESPYSQELLAQDMQDVRLVYRHNGYLHANVTFREQADSSTHTVDVAIIVDPGAQVKMGGFQVRTGRSGTSGPGLSDTSFLRSLWTIQTGQVVDGKYLSDFRAKLFETQLFSQVRLDDSLQRDSSGLSTLHLSVTERVPGESNYSAFWEPSYSGAGISASTRHKNLFGRFNEGSASALVAQRRQEAVLGYANPLLFGASITFIPTAIRFDNRILVSHERLPLPTDADSVEERWEAADRGDLSFGLNRAMRVRSFTELRYVDKVTDQLLKAKAEIGLDINLTNSTIEPTRGVRFRPSIGNGGGLPHLLSDQSSVVRRYWYFEWNSSYYLPIYGPLTSAFAVDYGHFFQPGIEDDARAFYQGGDRSVRGYRFRSILPSRPAIASDGTPTVEGGTQPTYIRCSEELRLSGPSGSWKKLQLVQFFDWARVTDADGSFARGQEASLGFGLRWRLEILTLRLDYAWQRNFQEILDVEPFSTGRISFDLSQAI